MTKQSLRRKLVGLLPFLLRLIRGKSCLRPQQMGQDFPRSVLVYPPNSGLWPFEGQLLGRYRDLMVQMLAKPRIFG